MDNQDFRRLQTRLDKLEAKNRLLAYCLFALLGCCFLGALLSAIQLPNEQNKDQSKGFELLDSVGKVMMEFSGVPKSTNALALYNAHGALQVEIGIAPDGTTSIATYNPSGVDRYYTPGKLRPAACEFRPGYPVRWLYDSDGKLRAALSTGLSGAPWLGLLDIEENKVFFAPQSSS